MFYPDLWPLIINNLDIGGILSTRLSCKQFKDITGKITHLRSDQTSLFITDLRDLQLKCKFLRKIMPKIKSMVICSYISCNDVCSAMDDLSIEEQLTIEILHGRNHAAKEHFKSIFSWLKNVDIKIDCELIDKSQGDIFVRRSFVRTLLVDYLLFSVRGNFKVDKYRKYVYNLAARENELHTAFKIKDGIMTLSKEFAHSRRISEVIYDEDSIHEGFQSLLLEGITGVKIKYPMMTHSDKCNYVMTKGKKKGLICEVYTKGNTLCTACSKKKGRPPQVLFVDIDAERLLPKFKGLPFTCNKTSVIRYV